MLLSLSPSAFAPKHPIPVGVNPVETGEGNDLETKETRIGLGEGARGRKMTGVGVGTGTAGFGAKDVQSLKSWTWNSFSLWKRMFLNYGGVRALLP